ncbi:MAG: methylmalonyl-CoA epimerase [candidate division WOR-3 bacterium]|uniref:Methylmalonyl-CoA epimerase n=1 Tax=candidate division WOR-3 bacterium TaxID=2052148 RepID=A0A7C4S140_UNCW3
MIKKISHIAIAVKSIEEARNFYEEILGLKIEKIEEIPERKVKVAFIPIGETRIELVEPISEDSPIKKFLEERGGIHHICFEVKEIEREMARLKEKGIKFTSEQPEKGAEGNLVCFIHPKSSYGVLIEFNEKKA